MLRAYKELAVGSCGALCRQRWNEEQVQRDVTSVLCWLE